MSLHRIQGTAEKREGIYYEFDSADTPLGEGGMGKVYKGRCIDERTGNVKNVAIKFLYEDLNEYAIEKGRREASIRFKHENLIEMLGFIETQSKSVLGETQYHYHVVSELLEGVTLDKLFEGQLANQYGKSMPYAEKIYKDYQQDANHFAVELIKKLLSGLMTMHDAGYIHRDIDPTNIMLTSEGKVKLIDFGIAKKMNSLTSHDKHLTSAGQFVGKPEYAAPELVLGEIDNQNQTTDLYAIGILMFQCIVGHVPFMGDRVEILQHQLYSPMPLKMIKHKGLRQIIKKATEKARHKRFQSAAEFRVALEGLRLTVEPPVPPFFKYVLGSVSVLGLVLVSIWYFSRKPVQPPLPPIPIVAEDTYSDAIDAIRNRNDLSVMERLSENGDADASYFLSRLFFRSNKAAMTSRLGNLAYTEYQPDSIAYLQSALRIVPDNYKAHRLLFVTLERKPEHYQALFELACDYWRTTDRTDAIQKPDNQDEQLFNDESRLVAEKYFHDSKMYAEQANDTLYVSMIEKYLAELKEWKKEYEKQKQK